MIAAELVERIRGLLAEGRLSQRQIARTLGVARGTVGAIASGRRRERVAEEPLEEAPPAGPPGYCRTCGGRVYLPCRLCAVRARPAAKERRRVWGESDEPPALALREEHRQRYEAVRRRLESQRAAAAARRRGGSPSRPYRLCVSHEGSAE